MRRFPIKLRPLAVLELLAWTAGVFCLVVLLVFHLQSTHAEAAAAHIAPQLAASAQAATDGSATPAVSRPPAVDYATFTGVIGRLELPALGLNVPILNDYDPDSLRRGVGRIRGTAVPGGLGNFVVAGHRDTYFRPLRHIAHGMIMRVVTPDGVFNYQVDATSIVLPSDVDVLDIGDRPGMTLITCYPFDYIGAAPKRFIVQAHLESVEGAAQ